MLGNVFWLAFFIQSAEIVRAAISKDAEICIIGGGLAGLSAADTLITAGFTNVDIIEAGPKIGGRVNPMQVPNGDGASSFDLGAPPRVVKDSPLYVIAQAQNLLAPTAVVDQLSAKKSQYSTASGCPLQQELIDQLETMYGNMDTSTKSLAAVSGTTDSVATIFDKAYGSYLQQNPTIVEPTSNFYKAMKDLTMKAFQFSNGISDLTKVSAKQIANFKDAQADQMLNKNGYQGILDYYQNKITTENIMTNTKVTRISYVNDAQVRLMFANSQTMDCDVVLITVPLAVLKRNSITFDPPLTQDKMMIMNNLGSDPTDTFVLVYDKPFWKNDMNALNMLRVEKDPWWCNFVFSFTETPLSKTMWYLEPHPYQANALIGYVGGGLDAAYFELNTSQNIMQTATDLMKKFMSKKDIPMPKMLLRSNTGADPNILGSASYYTTQCDQPGMDCDRSKLEAPIMITKSGVQTPVIYFAGEHTDPTGFGKANGAVAAGIRVAKAIAAS